MSAPCTADKDCLGGRGVCDAVTGTCAKGRCASPLYADQGDLARSIECAVFVPAAKALHGIGLGLWALTLCLALVAIRFGQLRDNARGQSTGRRILWGITLCTIANASYHALSISSSPFGARSVGNDIGTTTANALGMSLTWIILLSKPLVSRTGISASVFMFSNNAKTVYRILSPVLILGGVAASFIPFLLLIDNISYQVLVSAGFLMCACCGLLLLVPSVFTLRWVRSNINGILRETGNELPAERRAMLQFYKKRSTLYLVLGIVVTFVSVCIFVVFGVSAERASKGSWILVPVMSMLNCSWQLRHLLTKQVLPAYRVYFGVASQSTSEPGTTADPNDIIQPRGPPPRISPISSRYRRVRGLRRQKPLEIMSAVAERTAEGSVQNTMEGEADKRPEQQDRLSMNTEDTMVARVSPNE